MAWPLVLAVFGAWLCYTVSTDLSQKVSPVLKPYLKSILASLQRGLLPAMLALGLIQVASLAAEVDVQPLQSLAIIENGLSSEGVEVLTGDGLAISSRWIAPGSSLNYRILGLRGFDDIMAESIPASTYRVELRVYENADQIFGSGADAIHSRVLLEPEPTRQLKQGDSLTVSIPLSELPLSPGKSYRVALRIRDMTEINVLELQHRFEYAPGPTALAESPVQELEGIRLHYQGLAARRVKLKPQPEYKDEAIQIQVNEEIRLEFEDLSGFTEVEGKISPGLEMTLLDREGEVVLYYEDIFREQPIIKAGETIRCGIGITEMGGYVWSVRLFDKLSGRQMGTRIRLSADGPMFFDRR